MSKWGLRELLDCQRSITLRQLLSPSQGKVSVGLVPADDLCYSSYYLCPKQFPPQETRPFSKVS